MAKINVCYTELDGEGMIFIATDLSDARKFVTDITLKEGVHEVRQFPNLYISEQAIDHIVDKGFIGKQEDFVSLDCLLFETNSEDSLCFLMLMYNEFTMKSVALRKDYRFIESSLIGVKWTDKALTELGKEIDARREREPIYFGLRDAFRKNLELPIEFYFKGTCFHDLRYDF